MGLHIWRWGRVISALVVLFILLCGAAPAPADAAPVHPPEVASYVIEAAYDPETHQIAADELATYTNRTEAALTDVVLHLYLNAFRSADTLWMREAGFAPPGFGPDTAGWIEIGEARLAEGSTGSLVVEPVDDDATLVRIKLPAPVAPGESVTLALAFTAQLPRVFARTGWADGGDFVMAGQWFPKYGVWEEGAWNAYPFHARSEFYADFGTYDVTLALPVSWVVGATGVPVGEPEVDAGGMSVHTFRAEHVIDFAWSASPHFEVAVERAGDVEVEVYHYPDTAASAQRVMAATVEGLKLYDGWYGPYGMGLYPQLTVILVPPGAGGAGGMEYPTLFTVGSLTSGRTPACFRLMEAETVHELAHQWFQSVVATNEAEEPWLDEGFTEYSTVRAMNALYDGAVSSCLGWDFSYLAMRRQEYVAMPETPMAGFAWELDAYGVAAYSKPAVALTTLERLVGDPEIVAFLQTYYERYAFAHPTAVDVQNVMAETLGQGITAWFFDRLVNDTATLDARVDTAADSVTLVREGELCVPVDVLVNDKTLMPWPCGGPLQLDDAEVQTVEIDPYLIAPLDLDLVNNGRRDEADLASWAGLATRVLRVFQLLLGAGGP